MTHPVDAFVGANLKQRRKDLGMTLRELGYQTGIAYQQIQKYEKGENRIACSNLWNLAKALDTKVSFFFKGYKEAKVLQKQQILPDFTKLRADEAQDLLQNLNVIMAKILDQRQLERKLQVTSDHN